MLLATMYESGLYKLCLILHILCAIIGFGAVFLNGLYGQQMKVRMQSGRAAEAIGIFEANEKVSQIGEYFIYAVFVFGFAVLGLGDPVWKFSQTWVWLSVVLYVIALGLSHGVLMPTVKRMGVLMHEMAAGPPPVGGPPPQAIEMEALGKKLGVVGPVLNLFMIAILFLMVWKPGL
ncbi:MAG: hypothetical protein QOF40_566 [Actinomycetota bacterium]|jgi:uncharacterized membrane protein|nr:hypothetical protein [Actinomycetota bacterium]